MDSIKVSEAARAVNGSFTSDGEFYSVFTDSRKIEKNGLFIALEGDKFDGHQFCKQVEQDGAAAIMCRKKIESNIPVIYVDDTKKALLDLASFYRDRFDIPLIGLTGSVGKTTTKEMIALVCSEKYNTVKTQGNFNNNIGMPMTLFNINKDTECAVIEMGMNHSGELSLLTSVSRPTIGVITNIGTSHIENLGSRENILKAKLEMTEGLKQGAPLILNGDDDLLSSVKNDNFNISFFGIDNSQCDVLAMNIEEKDGKTLFDASVFGKKVNVIIPTIGIHNVYNALAGLSVGYFLGITPEESAKALACYVPSGMRQKIVNAKGVTFIEDCYNASPDSVKASVTALASLKAVRKIAVLGDMLELGDFSDKFHRESGMLCGKLSIDILYTLGEKSKLTAEEALKCGVKKAKCFTDRSELAKELANEIKPDDAVVFKASHSMKLEEVLCEMYKLMGIKE